MKKTLLSLCLLLSLLPMRLLATTEVYVVAVGVNTYKGEPGMSLNFCRQDAMKFASMMLTQTTHVTTLYDEQATRRAVYDKLKQVCSLADADDVVIFYYSGHGMPSGFCCHDIVYTQTGLTYTDMQFLFKGCKAKNKMVYADSCYSGKLRPSGRRSGSAGKKSPVMFFLSSRSNETSIEMKEKQNGVFTYYLVKGLSGAADSNHDKFITAKEIFHYVSYQVKQASRQRQHPVMWGKFADDMIVACLN